MFAAAGRNIVIAKMLLAAADDSMFRINQAQIDTQGGWLTTLASRGRRSFSLAV
jgi:hypothetical protein